MAILQKGVEIAEENAEIILNFAQAAAPLVCTKKAMLFGLVFKRMSRGREFSESVVRSEQHALSQVGMDEG